MGAVGVPPSAGVSDALKIIVSQDGGDTVVGLIAAGTAASLAASWDTPLMNATAGSVGGFANAMAVAQIATGHSSLATMNTTQVWQGNQSLSFTVNMTLVAFKDPKVEVMQALEYLGRFASPANVAEFVSFGATDIPKVVTLSVGRKLLIPDCVIESLSYPLDKERDADGNLLRAEVSMTINTKAMMNQSSIVKIWQN